MTFLWREFIGVEVERLGWEVWDERELVPAWVAYASHDFHGADLRRRWDDRVDLELVDGHPVVYAGAGSHAAYFRPGEYQA